MNPLTSVKHNNLKALGFSPVIKTHKSSDKHLVNYAIIASIILAFMILIYFISRKYFSVDARAQRQLNQYLKQNFSGVDLGKLYERYIGYLYEKDGCDVIYNGAINGLTDMGRDLIVKSGGDPDCANEVLGKV